MQANNSTNPSGFSWYTGAVNGQPAPASSTPASLTSVPITNASSGSEHHPPLPVQMVDIPNDGRTININAQNVYIEENGKQIRADNGGQPLAMKDGNLQSNVQKLHITDENKEVPLSVGVHDPSHTSTSSTNASTPLPTTAPTSSSSKSSAPSNDNPLGIPAPSATVGEHPPSQTGQSTSSSSTDPKTASTVPVAHNNNTLGDGKTGPDGLITPSTAPSATTTLKDGIHDTPLSTGTASDKFDTKPPLSTSSTSSTLPAHSDHPAEPKKKKEHKGIKEKFHDWKAHRKGGGENPAGSVHPKDSRDGKVLPSEDELSAKYMNMGGGEAASSTKNGLPKDKLDATGQSVTGSSANPSSKTNPFHAPEVPMRQAPVEAKHA